MSDVSGRRSVSRCLEAGPSARSCPAGRKRASVQLRQRKQISAGRSVEEAEAGGGRFVGTLTHIKVNPGNRSCRGSMLLFPFGSGSTKQQYTTLTVVPA